MDFMLLRFYWIIVLLVLVEGLRVNILGLFFLIYVSLFLMGCGI